MKALRLRLDLVVEPAQPGLMRIEPGDQRRPRRAAAGTVVELREPHAARRQRVEVRRRNLAAVAADVREAHVVDQHDDDVRPLGLLVRRAANARRQSRCQKRQCFHRLLLPLLFRRGGGVSLPTSLPLHDPYAPILRKNIRTHFQPQPVHLTQLTRYAIPTRVCALCATLHPTEKFSLTPRPATPRLPVYIYDARSLPIISFPDCASHPRVEFSADLRLRGPMLFLHSCAMPVSNTRALPHGAP